MEKIRTSIYLEKFLRDWILKKADTNERSFNKQLNLILKNAKKEEKK